MRSDLFAARSAMHPELTVHATARLRQRGIPATAIDCLEDFGHIRHDHRGAEILYMDHRSRRVARRAMGDVAYRRVEKLMNVYAVVADGRVVTVGHRTRRLRR
jgi:hypothetical protein